MPVAEAPICAEQLGYEFAEVTPAERVAEAHERFAGGVIVASSFGPTAPLLLKHVAEEAPGTPVVTIRHHHETLRTLELVDWYRQELGLDLHIYDAPVLPVPIDGSPAFAEFQQKIKVDMFQKILEDWRPRAYLSGIMRWQAPERADVPLVQDKDAALAINAVADVTSEEVEAFYEETGWPRDENYRDPTKGRGQNRECGLNTTNYEFSKEVEDA